MKTILKHIIYSTLLLCFILSTAGVVQAQQEALIVDENGRVKVKAQIPVNGTLHLIMSVKGRTAEGHKYRGTIRVAADNHTPGGNNVIINGGIEIRGEARVVVTGGIEFKRGKWFNIQGTGTFEGVSPAVLAEICGEGLPCDIVAANIFADGFESGDVSARVAESVLDNLDVSLSNYPNPFNPTTSISYRLEAEQQVQLGVYDMSGRLVRMLVNGTQPAGSYQVRFDAGDLPSGQYLYRIQTGSFQQTRRMQLLK